MIYKITISICWFVLRILYSFKIKGIENIPAKGTFIIACNHVSFLDPIAIGSSCPRAISYMAKEELFKNKFLKWYFGKLNIFPLKRFASDSSALRKAIKRLKKGGGSLIFPEGTRSEDGKLKEGKIGISLLSSTTQATIIPCYVSGSYDIWPRSGSFKIKGNLSVTYGKPIEPLVVKEKKKDYYEFAQKVMSHIKALHDEISHGQN